MSYDDFVGKRTSAPRRAVTEAVLRGGGSIMQPGFKHHWWELHLECGHVVERRIRWTPTEGRARRGWAGQWRGPSLERLPLDPQHARCELCGKGISA